MRLSLALTFAIALSGATACMDGSLATDETACANACSCSPDPFTEHSCNRQCVQFLEMVEVSQECLDCFADVTCPIAEGACEFQCGGVTAEELP